VQTNNNTDFISWCHSSTW